MNTGTSERPFTAEVWHLREWSTNPRMLRKATCREALVCEEAQEESQDLGICLRNPRGTSPIPPTLHSFQAMRLEAYLPAAGVGQAEQTRTRMYPDIPGSCGRTLPRAAPHAGP